MRLAEGRSPRGARTVQQILEAAHKVFVEEGYAGLTFRRVAAASDITVGNVNYYFSTKHELIVATLKEALADYVEAHIHHVKNAGPAPIDILLEVVSFYVRGSEKSHPLFFQMWGYAGAEAEAKAVIRDLYRPIGRFIYYLVKACNPSLDHLEARKVVFQIFSLEQGMKLFIGMGPADDIAIQVAEDTIREATRKLVMGA